MRTLPALSLVLAAALPAQHESAPHPKLGATPAPVHHARLSLPPMGALRHLQDGNLLVRQARATRREPPAPARRPSGTGRYLAAVIVCADADIDTAALLGQRRKDLLVLSLPGPHVGAAELALLEQMATKEDLPLCVVLTHEGCASLQPQGDDEASKRLRDRSAVARAMAAQRGKSVATAQSLWTKESILASSPELSKRVADGKFRVAPGIVDPRTYEIRWLLTNAERLPMPPVRAR